MTTRRAGGTRQPRNGPAGSLRTAGSAIVRSARGNAAVAFVLLSGAAACGASQDAPSIAGTWTAVDVVDDQGALRSLTLTLEIVGDSVSGTYFQDAVGHAPAFSGAVIGRYDFPLVTLAMRLQFPVYDGTSLPDTQYYIAGIVSSSGRRIEGTASITSMWTWTGRLKGPTDPDYPQPVTFTREGR